MGPPLTVVACCVGPPGFDAQLSVAYVEVYGSEVTDLLREGACAETRRMATQGARTPAAAATPRAIAASAAARVIVAALLAPVSPVPPAKKGADAAPLTVSVKLTR